VLQRFSFTYSLPQSTPLPTSHSLSSPPSDESVEPSGPYPKLVGCLVYLMTCTRPDLAYPLSLLARYVAPGRHRKVHWDDAKRVLRYLCSTLGMGLVLGGRARVVLTGHADASWVDDLATQRSSQGYTFSLSSGSVSWRSSRSSSVFSSSCEAEIYAGAMAAQELRWLTYLLTNLGEAPHSPPVLLRGDFVIHPELALPFLTGLVTSCSPPFCLWGRIPSPHALPHPSPHALPNPSSHVLPNLPPHALPNPSPHPYPVASRAAKPAAHALPNSSPHPLPDPPPHALPAASCCTRHPTLYPPPHTLPAPPPCTCCPTCTRHPILYPPPHPGTALHTSPVSAAPPVTSCPTCYPTCIR
ncbi:unnamed protein product, partial [Closterium sp. NIES-54]